MMIKNKLAIMILGIGILLCTYPQDLRNFGGATNEFWVGLFVVVLVGFVIGRVLVYLRKTKEL